MAADRITLGGLIPFSSVDYPGELAAVLFCQGCPWRCGYCQNPHLQTARAECGPSWEQALAFARTRRGLLDAVVFSGGEPTAQPGLANALAEVKALGFKTGLHTAGIYPRQLARALPWLDWVGLDLKAPLADYPSITGVEGSGEATQASLELLLAQGTRYELRTTWHPQLLPLARREVLAYELAARKVERWVLQAYRPWGCRTPLPAMTETEWQAASALTRLRPGWQTRPPSTGAM
jgi:pyruvate formate lyase activating enzyme